MRGHTRARTGMATLEWTKAHALRETEWRSASLSLSLCNVTTVRRTSSDPNDPGSQRWQIEDVGLSLSESHYDVLSARRYSHARFNASGGGGRVSGGRSGGRSGESGGERERFSAENAVWVRTRVLPLRHPVRFVAPPRRFRSSRSWTIASVWPSSEEEVSLVFTPAGSREASFAGPLRLVEVSLRPASLPRRCHVVVTLLPRCCHVVATLSTRR